MIASLKMMLPENTARQAIATIGAAILTRALIEVLCICSGARSTKIGFGEWFLRSFGITTGNAVFIAFCPSTRSAISGAILGASILIRVLSGNHSWSHFPHCTGRDIGMSAGGLRKCASQAGQIIVIGLNPGVNLRKPMVYELLLNLTEKWLMLSLFIEELISLLG